MGVQSIMHTVVETAEFQKQAKAVWNDAEREEFIDWISDNPNAGDVIPGADGARKVRWSRPGMGKRGGVRVIYFHLTTEEIVLLVMVYAKAAQANVKPKDIKRGAKL
jgi:mRNA-degrading endonuclease RelE of RelBE toxin-antitoxin system